MTNKPSYLIAALLMMPVLASACDAVCQRMQRQQQRDMNYQMHLQETQRIQGQYNQGYSAPAPTYYPRHGATSQGKLNNGQSTLSMANGYPTREMAEEAALSSCQAKGANGCRIVFGYQNNCFALAQGEISSDSYLFSGAHPNSKVRAEWNAMKKCRAGGAKNCEIHVKTQCALPARTPY